MGSRNRLAESQLTARTPADCGVALVIMGTPAELRRQALRRSLGHDPSPVDDHDAVARHRDFGKDVRREHDGAIVRQLGQDVIEAQAFLGIEAGPVLAAYSTEAPERDREMLEEMKELLDRRAAGKRRGWVPALVVASLVALVAGAVWLLRPKEAPPALPPPPPVAEEMEQPAPEEPPRLRVTQSGIGTDIVERNLSGRGSRFVEGTKLWYWTRVLGGESGERIARVNGQWVLWPYDRPLARCCKMYGFHPDDPDMTSWNNDDQP